MGGARSGSTIRVPSGKTKVVVLGTNTAVFEYKLSSEPVESPEGKQLNAFLKKFGPYLVDVPTTELEYHLQTLVGAPSMSTNILGLQNALKTLDREIDRVRKRQIMLLKAFSEESAIDLSREVKTICSGSSIEEAQVFCRNWAKNRTDALIDDYEMIQKHLSAVVAPLTTAETKVSKMRQLQQSEDTATMLRALEANLAQASDLTKSARKALDDSSDVLAMVRELERLALDGLDGQELLDFALAADLPREGAQGDAEDQPQTGCCRCQRRAASKRGDGLYPTARVAHQASSRPVSALLLGCRVSDVWYLEDHSDRRW